MLRDAPGLLRFAQGCPRSAQVCSGLPRSAPGLLRSAQGTSGKTQKTSVSTGFGGCLLGAWELWAPIGSLGGLEILRALDNSLGFRVFFLMPWVMGEVLG